MDLLGMLIEIDAWFVNAVDQTILNNLFCLALAIAALANRKNNNILLLCSVVLIPKIMDIYFLDVNALANLIGSAWVFVVIGLADTVILLLIAFRARVFKGVVSVALRFMRLVPIFQKRTVSLVYQRHIDEYWLMLIYVVYVLVSLITASEYYFRAIGYENALYAYYSYTPIKVALNVLEITLFFKIGIHASLKSQGITRNAV